MHGPWLWLKGRVLVAVKVYILMFCSLHFLEIPRPFVEIYLFEGHLFVAPFKWCIQFQLAPNVGFEATTFTFNHGRRERPPSQRR